MSCEFEKDYVVCLNDATPQKIDEWADMVVELKRRELEKENKRLKAEHREECKSGW